MGGGRDTRQQNDTEDTALSGQLEEFRTRSELLGTRRKSDKLQGPIGRLQQTISTEPNQNKEKTEKKVREQAFFPTARVFNAARGKNAGQITKPGH